MPLSANQKRFLRGLGQQIRPVVMVGQHGLRDAVVAEIDQALDAHELVKVKIAADRDTRSAWGDEIIARVNAEPVHRIGQMLIMFRRNDDKPKIALPST
jgi:RNA-binding protein